MIAGFIALLVCQLIGEFAVRVAAVPIPGPVVGMVLLLIALQLRRPGPRPELSGPRMRCCGTCSCCSSRPGWA